MRSIFVLAAPLSYDLTTLYKSVYYYYYYYCLRQVVCHSVLTTACDELIHLAKNDVWEGGTESRERKQTKGMGRSHATNVWDELTRVAVTWQAVVVVERAAQCWAWVTVWDDEELSQRQTWRVGSVESSITSASWGDGDDGTWLISALLSLIMASCSTSSSTFMSSVSHFIYTTISRHTISRFSSVIRV